MVVGHPLDVSSRQNGNVEEGYYSLLLRIRAVALSDNSRIKSGKIPALAWRFTSNHTDRRSAATQPPAANLDSTLLNSHLLGFHGYFWPRSVFTDKTTSETVGDFPFPIAVLNVERQGFICYSTANVPGTELSTITRASKV